MSLSACDRCLRRTALIAALAPWLDVEWRRRSAPSGVLSLPDDALVALDRSGRVARAHAAFSPGRARERITAARLTAACRCSESYPERLRELADPPAVLHVAGHVDALERSDGVAIVGARRGTTYGLEVSRSLGRGLTAAGLPVVSGMAMGVDSAAHVGALENAVPRAGSSEPREAARREHTAGGEVATPAAGLGQESAAHSEESASPAGLGQESAAHGEESASPAGLDQESAAHGEHSASPAGPDQRDHGAHGEAGAVSGEAGDHLATAPTGAASPGHAVHSRAPARPVAVLAGGADVPYPASRRRLHAQLVAHGCVVSELPPGFTAYRWCFVARNRLIAGLAALTVVVEATERSGSLTTADFAEQLGRPVGAVPGPVTSRFSTGTNMLLASGAGVVRDTRDVLDQLLGPSAPPPGETPQAVPIEPRLRRLLDAIERGHGSLAELTSDPDATCQVLQDLTDLELRGLVRREFGGRYVRALEGRG